MRTVSKAVLIVGAVTLVAGALRLHDLGRPSEKVFDETYYASDACLYAGEPFLECDLDNEAERSWVHPPLGKQLIALGIDAFGNRPFGWRVAAALAGTAMVALIGMIAFLLFASPLWAGIAALLAGTEHLLFVQSRIAMLDIFLAFFVVLGFALLVWDRVRADRRARELEASAEPEIGEQGPGPRHRRPLRALAGASFGAAVAVKWSGVLALAAAAILALAWERTRRKRAGDERPLWRAVEREGFSLWLAFVLVPLIAYALPWIPWVAERNWDLGEWLRHHGDMAGYHFGLDTVRSDGEPIHPYMSRAWSWFLLLRPVAYYWQGDPRCCEEIIGIGSPFLVWGGLIVIPYLAMSWRARRDWRAGLILLPILFQFVPWLVVSRPLFLFYMTPVTPFLALGMTYAVGDLLRSPLDRRISAVAATAVVLVGVVTFAFFFPLLVGDQVTYEAWRSRIWFDGWI